MEDGWITADTASVAAAVFDHNGRPIAAVGVTVGHQCPDPATRRPGCSLEALVGPLSQTVAALTGAIGGRSPAPDRAGQPG